MVEEWRIELDSDNTVGAILMELLKAFHCIPYDLLRAKLNAYGMDENVPILMYFYLKRRKQSVRIDNTYSSFQSILAGVPQGSVLGPILFNFYITDLSLFIKQATLYSYNDGNTLAFFSTTYSNLIGVLEKEAGVALTWLKRNQMIASPEKFQVILLRNNQTNTG